MAISPRADYIVAIQDKPETKTQSGILLPENAAQVPNSAKVVAVGENVKDVKVDDKIIYKNVTSSVTVADVDYLIINTEDAVATLSI